MPLPYEWRFDPRAPRQVALLPPSWEVGSPYTVAGLRLTDDEGRVKCVVAVLMWN